MAFRIDKAVIRGEICNEERGVVTGKIWLVGRKDPLLLELQGNCLRDLAGCRLNFFNPDPQPEMNLESLATLQEGVVGEMTASRKVKVPTVTDEQLYHLVERHEPIPFRISNSVYLEWYSEANGRVLIETIHCQCEITMPEWMMTAAEESEQRDASQVHFHEFIDAITGDAEMDDEADEAGDEEFEDEGPAGEDLEADAELNEFEWEQELRDADRRAEAYQEAFDKYKDHPERERMISEALGWDDEDDDDEEEGAAEGDAESLEDAIEVDALPPFPSGTPGDRPAEKEPPAEAEWADWADDLDMSEHHPLSQRAMDFALVLQREADERGLMGSGSEVRDNPVLTLILHIIALGGKLAGGLDGWAQGLEPEPGFVIAMLKRAQVPLNEALHAFDCIDLGPLTEDTRKWLNHRKRELFDLRREIIDLMHQLRAKQG